MGRRDRKERKNTEGIQKGMRGAEQERGRGGVYVYPSERITYLSSRI